MSTPRREMEEVAMSAAHGHVKTMMTANPCKFKELVVHHIAYYTEMDGDKLDLFVNGKKSARKSSLMRLAASPFYRKSRLELEREREQACFPGVVVSDSAVAISTLISSLNNARDIKEEGLFRKSGSVARQKDLKVKIVEDCSISLNPYTVHDRANVIKLLISDSAESLLLDRNLEPIRQALDRDYQKSQEGFRDGVFETAETRCLRVFQLVMLMLPHTNWAVVRQLVPLLQAVAMETANKMDRDALATVFGPHFLCGKDTQSDPVAFTSALGLARDAVIFMVRMGARIFDVPMELSRDVILFLRTEEQQPGRGDAVTPSTVPRALSMATPDNTPRQHAAAAADLQDAVIPCSSSALAVPVDDAEYTEREVQRLLQHVSSLPDADREQLKKKVIRSNAVFVGADASTPRASGDSPAPRRAQDTPRKRYRSKSIGYTIRKRLPAFGWSKRQSSCETDTDSPAMVVVNIDFEDKTTEKAAVIDCQPQEPKETKQPAPRDDHSSPSPCRRRRRRHSQSQSQSSDTPPQRVLTQKENVSAAPKQGCLVGENAATPPKQKCLDKENVAVMPHQEGCLEQEKPSTPRPSTSVQNVAPGDAPLPYAENEIGSMEATSFMRSSVSCFLSPLHRISSSMLNSPTVPRRYRPRTRQSRHQRSRSHDPKLTESERLLSPSVLETAV